MQYANRIHDRDDHAADQAVNPGNNQFTNEYSLNWHTGITYAVNLTAGADDETLRLRSIRQDSPGTDNQLVEIGLYVAFFSHKQELAGHNQQAAVWITAAMGTARRTNFRALKIRRIGAHPAHSELANSVLFSRNHA